MRTWLRSKVTLLFMTLGLLLAMAGVAYADNAIADGDGVTPLTDNPTMAFGNVGCNVASTNSALVAISRNGAAGSTNVFANSSTVTVTAAATGNAALSAAMDSSTITLPSNWSSLDNNTLSNNVSSTVTVNSSAPGPGSGTVTFTASGKNTSGATITRTDTVNVTWTTGSCDTTAPSVSSIAVADANPTNTTDPLDWTVTFSESVTGVDAADFNLVNTGLGGSPAITNVSGSGDTYTVTASSGSGSGTLGLNLTDNDSIKDAANNPLGGTGSGNGNFTGDVYVIDRTAPTMTGSAVLGPDFTDPYTADTWTNQSVRVTFTCADTGGSGLTGTSGNNVQNFTTETSGTTATSGGTCADNAGNTAAAANFGPIKIDLTNPVVSLDGAATGTQGTSPWYTGVVTQPFKASDALSGLVGHTSPYNFSENSGTQEGSNVLIASGAFSDNAGNSNPGINAGPFQIDLTDPTIQASLVDGSNNPLAAASTGWYNISTGAPKAHYTCDDVDGDANAANGGASGVASCGPDHLFGSNALAQSDTGTVTDNAGRSNTASVNNVKVDLSKPTGINFTGTNVVADGATYDFNSVPAAPTGCTASDTFSGMPANGCVLDNGYGTGVGPHTIKATATDTAGNVETKTLSYTVAPYTLNGFYQPIDMNNTVNTVKNGSTVPVKFELFQSVSGTELTSTSAVTSIKYNAIACGALSGDPEDAIETVATGGTSLRYDTTAGQFIYNWTTPKGANQVGKCYTLTMTAADNSPMTAYFKLK